jgi:hypothetical protein
MEGGRGWGVGGGGDLPSPFGHGTAAVPQGLSQGTGASHTGVSYYGNGLKVYDSEHTIPTVIPLSVEIVTIAYY